MRLSVFVLLGALAALPSTARAQDVRGALEAAERGSFDAAQFPGIAAHPLYGWVEYAALRRNIDTLPPARGQSFLQRHRGEAVGEAFRSIWLASLSRREDWPAFRAAWSP